jgi:hypothetical protein
MFCFISFSSKTEWLKASGKRPSFKSFLRKDEFSDLLIDDHSDRVGISMSIENNRKHGLIRVILFQDLVRSHGTIKTLHLC